MKPFGGWPRPFRSLNEPIRSLVGEYEAGLVRDGTYRHSTILWYCDAIEAFFYDHPKVKRPEQILITDVEDWRLAKQREYSYVTVRTDLCALRAFFNWLIREKGVEMDCPVFVPPAHPLPAAAD